MASGKSTVATALSDKLGWQFVDLDRRIEDQEKRTINEIFASHGEQYFRDIETRILRKLLNDTHVVVATGGGTFVYGDNVITINKNGASVWLDVSFETVIRRLSDDDLRPLARNHDEMKALYQSRQAGYKKAHLHVDANQSTAEQLTDTILNKIGHFVITHPSSAEWPKKRLG